MPRALNICPMLVARVLSLGGNQRAETVIEADIWIGQERLVRMDPRWVKPVIPPRDLNQSGRHLKIQNMISDKPAMLCNPIPLT